MDHFSKSGCYFTLNEPLIDITRRNLSDYMHCILLCIFTNEVELPKTCKNTVMCKIDGIENPSSQEWNMERQWDEWGMWWEKYLSFNVLCNPQKVHSFAEGWALNFLTPSVNHIKLDELMILQNEMMAVYINGFPNMVFS